MEEKNIFRTVDTENITSPEQLTDYIKVSSPSVWVVLCAIVLLFVSFIIWSIYGLVEVNTLDVNNQTKTELIHPIHLFYKR